MKGAIDAALSYRDSVELLSRSMGINAGEASVLNAALKMVGVSTETYVSANMRLAMHLKTNESGLNQLGVATRDVNGSLLSQTEIFQNAITAMQAYKAGADQNQFALYAFGRNAQAVYEIMRLNKNVMAEAQQVARAFGLELTPQGVEAMERYREKLGVLGLLFDAIKIKVGTVLLGEFSKMSAWFLDIGPTAINVFVGATKLCIASAEAIGIIFKSMAPILGAVANSFLTIAISVIKVAEALLHLKVTEAVEAVKKGASDFATGWKAAFTDIEKNASSSVDRIKALFGSVGGAKGEAPATPGVGAGTKAFVAPETPSDLLAKWKDQFRQMEMAENAFYGLSKETSLKFWNDRLAEIKGKGKDQEKLRLEVNSEIFAIEKKGAHDALEATINALKVQQESEKITADQRIALQDKIIAAVVAAGAKETSIYREKVLEREKLVEQEATKEIQQQEKILEAHLAAATTTIESKIKQVNTDYELGNISASKQLEQLKTLLNEKYRLELETYNKIRMLWAQYPQRWQEGENQITKATAKHDADLQAAENKTSLEINKSWTKALDGITNSLNINWIAAIKGTENLRDQMVSMGENIANSMINSFAREFAQFVIYETLKVVLGKAMSKELTLSKVANNAVSAAAGAYSAMSDIPIIGPVLGAIAAAVVFAAVMALGASVGSAAGGWDVDRDSLGMVHAKEMVLPANIAEGFRGIIANQGGSGGSPQQRITINNNIQGWDGADVRRMLVKHGPTIYGTLKNRGRPYGIR